MDRLLAAWPGAHHRLHHALELDPDFALGHAAMARLLQMGGRLAEARAAAGRARALASRRERQHVEALALLVEGEAGAAVEAHVEEFPTDSLGPLPRPRRLRPVRPQRPG